MLFIWCSLSYWNTPYLEFIFLICVVEFVNKIFIFQNLFIFCFFFLCKLVPKWLFSTNVLVCKRGVWNKLNRKNFFLHCKSSIFMIVIREPKNIYASEGINTLLLRIYYCYWESVNRNTVSSLSHKHKQVFFKFNRF